MEQNIWIQDGNTFMKGTTKAHPEGLPKGIYEVKESMTGYYLNRLGDSFVFNYKLYGINNEFIDHFVKTYNNTTGNLGVLFNGIKVRQSQQKSFVIVLNFQLLLLSPVREKMICLNS